MVSDESAINNTPLSCTFSPQDYDSIIKLVETLNNLPMCLVAGHQNIKFHYIFALNRYPHSSHCISCLVFSSNLNQTIVISSLVSAQSFFVPLSA